MIFLRYESFKGYLKSYPVTATIAALCILVFIITLILGDSAYAYGAFITVPEVDPWGIREPWRYMTSVFMHADFGHLFHNMMMLIIFAPPLEYIMKSYRYLGLYILSGIGGNILSALISYLKGDLHIAVGASGAIFGVFGAYFFLVLFRKQFLDSASIRTVYIILAISLISSILIARIDFWGHVGGFLSGFMLYRFFDQLQIMKHQTKR